MQQDLEQRIENLEKRTDAGEAYFWSSDVPELIGKGTPSISSFRRRVSEGAIGTVDVGGREAAYKAEDVRRFLGGKLTLKRGGVRRVKSEKPSQHKEVIGPVASAEKAFIDFVRPDDLPAVYFMESVQLGFERAIFPTSILSWLSKDDRCYWMLCDPKDRKDVRAVLGILPLKEEIILKLLKGELAARDINAADVLSYEAGKSYSCFVTSATTLPDAYGSIMLLMQRLLDYWCERSIHISKLYLSILGLAGESAALHLAQGCFFSPLDEYGEEPLICRLHLDRFSLSPLIRDYQKCLQQRNSKKEDNSMIMTTAPALPHIPKVKEELGDRIREGARDFAKLSHGLYHVDKDGRLVRDGLVAENAFFRPICSDDDIRATLRINASLFGASKNYTEDELVEHRRAWLQKNNDIYRVLEVNGCVVGFINAFPFPMHAVKRILAGEIRVGDVHLDDLLEYKPGSPVNVYLQTVGVHKDFQGHLKRLYGWFLISGFWSMVNNFGQRGIELDSLYTRSDELDGINLSKALGLEEIPVPGVNKIVFRLNFSKSNLFLGEYQTGLEEYRRAHSVEGKIA